MINVASCNVVSCIDGSTQSFAVSQAATWASQRLQAPLVLLHVLEKHSTLNQEDLSGNIGLGSREQLLAELTELDAQHNRLVLEHGRRVLDLAEATARQFGASDITQQQRHGHLLDTVLELEEDTRLFVMGRLGVSNELTVNRIGSQVETIARAIQRPILVTTGEFKPPENFMIAYDGSETADRAIDRIAASPLLKGFPCHLVSVGNSEGKRQADINRASSLLRGHGFEVKASIIAGEVQPSLTQYVKEHHISLMAMGAYGCSRIREFLLGSNTTKMISRSEVPLLLLR